jgi:hypothetical protein
MLDGDDKDFSRTVPVVNDVRESPQWYSANVAANHAVQLGLVSNLVDHYPKRFEKLGSETDPFSFVVAVHCVDVVLCLREVYDRETHWGLRTRSNT